MWKCLKCNEDNKDDFDTCLNCGSDKPIQIDRCELCKRPKRIVGFIKSMFTEPK